MTALTPRAVLVAGAGCLGRHTAATTIGVLITIPEPVSAELSRWRDRFVTPPVPGVPAHITLLPPTLVPSDDLAAIERHLRRAVGATGRFEVHLRGSGTFLPVSPVTFVQVAAGIGPCEVLESQIRSGPLARPLEFPYHPHVTVAHNVAPRVLDEVDAGLAQFDATFPVTRIDLYQALGHSDGPDAWTVRAAFPLAPSLPVAGPDGVAREAPAPHRD